MDAHYKYAKKKRSKDLILKFNKKNVIIYKNQHISRQTIFVTY